MAATKMFYLDIIQMYLKQFEQFDLVEYAQFCYEMGNAYWYYYEHEENRQSNAVSWFNTSLKHFENNEELVALIYIVKHLKSHGINRVHLDMPYIPNARQDRVKSDEDVFTLKYFAEVINSLNFASVTVLDPHSVVSEALIDRVIIKTPAKNIEKVLEKIGEENFATISDDMGKIITGRSSMEKEISERDTTITGLKEKNQQLVDANASLFKQIPTSSSNTSSKNDDEDELPLSKTSLRDAFDKNGNFKH